MVQKIEGWASPIIDMHPMNLAASFTVRANRSDGEVRCTVVMGEERVYTESEVKAIGNRLIEQAMVIPGDDSHYPFQAVEVEDVVKAFVDAGIVLDPA